MTHGDIRTAAFNECDACVILDVLHYLDPASQDDVLARVRASLADGGILLLRIADRAQAWRFALTMAADRLGMLMRGDRHGRYYCRTLAEWRERLERLGFAVEAVPMSVGTPFANVLLLARYHRAVPRPA